MNDFYFIVICTLISLCAIVIISAVEGYGNKILRKLDEMEKQK